MRAGRHIYSRAKISYQDGEVICTALYLPDNCVRAAAAIQRLPKHHYTHNRPVKSVARAYKRIQNMEPASTTSAGNERTVRVGVDLFDETRKKSYKRVGGAADVPLRARAKVRGHQ